MNRVVLPRETVHVASKWNELTPAQLLRVVHVLFTPASESQLQARLICQLLQLWKNPRRCWTLMRMRLLDLEQFRKLTEFLINAPVALTKQLLPRVSRRPWLRPWYGPGDLLATVTFAEWIDAESALFHYRQTNKEHFLNRLVAILYRPAASKPNASTGDRRKPYASHELEARTAQAGQLSIDVRRAILMYYEGCRMQLMKLHPDVYSAGDQEEDEDQAQQPAAAPENPAPRYLSILRELAGSPDKFDVMGQQPIGNILYDLNARIVEAAELEEKLEQQRHDR